MKKPGSILLSLPTTYYLLSTIPLYCQSPDASLFEAPLDSPSQIDISVTAEPAYYSWSEISTSPKRGDYSYFVQRGNINLAIKENPWLFNFRMENINLAGSDNFPTQLQRANNRYPTPGSGVFVSQAYLAYEGTWKNWPLRLQTGSIPINSEETILLSDNGLGVFGLETELKGVGPADLTYRGGNTETSGYGQEKLSFHYGSVSLSRMGRWNLGFMSELDKTPRQLSRGQVFSKARRKHLFINYDQRLRNFSFHAQTVNTEGSYTIAGVPNNLKIPVRATAFAFEGAGSAKIPGLEGMGPMTVGVLYAQGSGDKEQTSTDESYFAPLANRFNGAKRTGWGRLLGATTFDALASSGTWNGLPQGLSGVTTFGLSFTTKSYKTNLGFPVQLGLATHSYRATQGKDIPKSLGSEISFLLASEISERFRMENVFFNFAPGTAYNVAGTRPDSIQGLQTSITLSFR